MIDRAALTAIVQQLDSGGQLLESWKLEGGVSAITDAFEFRRGDGRISRMVLRQHTSKEWKPHEPGATGTEFELLQTLHPLGMPVPGVRMHDSSAELLPNPFLVMDFIEGTTEVSQTELPEVLVQMADFLFDLHTLDIDSVELPALPELEDPVEGLADYLPSGPLARRLLSVLEAQRPTSAAKPRALLHGDYWPGNLLWRDGHLAAVLDWEDASIGDPLSDLAACRVELLCQYDHGAMEAFTRHYLSRSRPTSVLATEDAGKVTSKLEIWEAYVSAAALETMSEWGLAPEEEHRRRAKTHQFFERAAEQLLSEAGRR